ncbi:MAG: tetratricopeptide repeat protein [Gemmatimonadetes bacterium]|nr:tetratricopeptide repeat protein [Gemmatimonadota bacterium]
MTEPARPSLFAELKRRRVFRVVVVYALAAWVVLQVAELVLPALLLPEWTFRLVVVLALLGFPIAIALAWVFDVTPEGVRRTGVGRSRRGRVQPSDVAPAAASRRMLYVWASVVVVVLGYAGFNRYFSGGKGGPGAGISSIAVLPLVNMSADAENEYFSDGMTEELLNALAQLEGLQVAARTSSFAFKGKELDVREIGRKLGVSAVLEGSVRRSGNRLRVTAQLINVEDGYHLWSETYERELADVFAVQDEISRAIVDALKLKLARVGRDDLVARSTDDVAAYDLYLKGRFHWNKRTGASMRLALEYFRQALERDPTFARAYAGQADVYALLSYYGHLAPRAGYEQARAAARRALELDPDVAEAHASLGLIALNYDWDWDSAEREFRRALELNPSYAIARQWYVNLLTTRGRYKEAAAQSARARALDPLDPIIASGSGTLALVQRQWDTAIAAYQHASALNPDHPGSGWLLSIPYSLAGRHEEAIAQIARADSVAGSPITRSVYGWALARAGRTSEARKILAELESLAARAPAPAYSLALVYIGLGEKDRTLDWLERAIEQHESVGLQLSLPDFDVLRGELRFRRIVQRMNLPASLLDSPAAPARAP